jgi:ATP/ADP translocase
VKKLTKLPQTFFPGVFFPVIVLFTLLMASVAFLKDAGSALDVMAGINTPFLKMASWLATSFFAIGFACLLYKASLRKWLPRLLIIMIGFVGLLAFLENNLAAPAEAGIPWKFYFVYCGTHLLCPTLISVLLWGYVNQITHLREGLQYYIPLSILGSICSSLLQRGASHLLIKTSDPLLMSFIYALFLVLMAVVLLMWLNRKISLDRWTSEEDEAVEKNPGKPILAFGYALGALGFVQLFLNVNFKESFRKLFDSPAQYSLFLANHSIMIGAGTIVITLIVLFVGPLLLKYKGWRFTSLISPVVAAAFLIAIWLGLPILKYNQLVFGAIGQALLFPVMQIAYLSLRKENRFKTKAWAELIVVPLFVSLASLFNQTSIVYLGTTLKLLPYWIILPVLVVGTLIVVLYKIGSRKGLAKASL